LPSVTLAAATARRLCCEIRSTVEGSGPMKVPMLVRTVTSLGNIFALVTAVNAGHKWW
jgi:hypothetical protein